ncbi:D-arabinono-1,4-lactone oxidase [Savitreella phatthalungensis]
MLTSTDSDLPRLSNRNGSAKDPQIGVKHSSYKRFSNWARTFTCEPQHVFWPQDIWQVKKVLEYARTTKQQVTAIGAGHSPGDIACSDSIMISLDAMCKVVAVDAKRRYVTVEGGMRMNQLHKVLDSRGFALENLGSISEQSVAGMLATATHGSSLRRSILGQCVKGLKLVTAQGEIIDCSTTTNKDVFHAAQVHLGALGIIVEITLAVDDAFDIQSTRSVLTFETMLDEWKAKKLWEAAEYVRVWWFPYSRRAIRWEGARVRPEPSQRCASSSWYRSTLWAYHIHQVLLCVGRLAPRFGPNIERLVFRQQYGACQGKLDTAIQSSQEALNMNCLFSQYVDEWSLPLEMGIEACRRLDLWLSGDDEAARIPFSSEGVFVHAPIELRVATGQEEGEAWLSTSYGGPTCYIGVIMYKPYGFSVPYRRFFQAYEYLMRDLGGRPHWAKQFDVGPRGLSDMYPKFHDWLAVRRRLDPTGMFANAYHQRHLLGDQESGLGNLAGMSGRKWKARL